MRTMLYGPKVDEIISEMKATQELVKQVIDLLKQRFEKTPKEPVEVVKKVEKVKREE